MTAALLALALASAPDLVDASAVVPGVRLDLRYATSRNLAGRPLVGSARCLLLRPVAARLARAEAAAEARGFRLLLWDCYRPPSVQAVLWRIRPDRRFVADPAKGSNHTRGAAVDVSLVALDGGTVEMPTDHDAFERRARPDAGAGVSPAAREHRRVLAEAMGAAGFRQSRGEWWHFWAPEAAGRPLLDLPMDAPEGGGAR